MNCHWRKSRWHNCMWITCIGERYFEKVPEICPYCGNKIRENIEVDHPLFLGLYWDGRMMKPISRSELINILHKQGAEE